VIGSPRWDRDEVNMPNRSPSLLLSFLFASCVAALPARALSLVGVEAESGTLYRISAADASITAIGGTGLPFVENPARVLAGLERAADGTLYAFTAGDDPVLYTIDDGTGAATAVGALGIGFVFEGGLAFSPGGTAHGLTQLDGDMLSLFTIDLTTGAATLGAMIPDFEAGELDVNGLAWRSDGVLVGHDRVSNALVVIDPGSGAVATLAALSPTVGAVGGIAVWNGVGYLATASTDNPSGAGSDELWSFDLFTGAASLIGSLGTTGRGIAGLAVPEPATGALLALGALALGGGRGAARVQDVPAQSSTRGSSTRSTTCDQA
jgi:hypothetical protein